MTQSKVSSVTEVCLNTASGFLLSCVLWRYVVVPYLGLEPNLADNVSVTLLFTVTSIARGYVWRRVFNQREEL